MAVWELISFGDKYIEKERPWETKNKKAIYNLLFLIGQVAYLLQPFLPQTSKKIFKQLGVKPEAKEWKFRVRKKEVLFPKID